MKTTTSRLHMTALEDLPNVSPGKTSHAMIVSRFCCNSKTDPD